MIAALADRQHGVVARRQILAAGGSGDAIYRAIAKQRLRVLHRGVYAVGHRELKPDGHRLAAVLACGERAVLSHAGAGAHWGLRPSAATRIDVIVPTSAGRQRPAIRIHRCAVLRPEETTMHRGIPVTTPARTLLDLAATLPRRSLERALEEAEVLRLFDLQAVRAIVSAHGGRPGAPALASLIEAAAGDTLTRSALEERFLALCDAHGLPRPRVNARVQGLEVDFHWPAGSLVVEVDGYAFHHTRRAFERDRERDAILAAAGIRTHRFTQRQIVGRPIEVARAVARSLST